MENSLDNVTIVDPDGTLRYASPAFGRMLGYDPEEVVGKLNVLDHVHPADLPFVLEETEKALGQGGVTSNRAEYRFRHADGSWRWVESIGTYLLEDPYVGVVVQTRDITERKQAEEALRRSEAEIFSVLESISDAFFSLDNEWRFSYVNRKAGALFERKREDLIGERIWEDSTFYPHYRRAMAEETTASFEGYYPPLDKWFSVRAYPSGSGLSVYLQDVTKRKRAEEKIRLQGQLLGAVGEAVVALDLEGRVLYWNRAAQEMYGWSDEEAVGRLLREMVVPEGLRERAEEIASQLREGWSWSGEFVARRRDGTTFPVEATDTPVFGEDGDLIGVIGVIRDVSERKEAEEALGASEERLRSLADSAFEGILITDKGEILEANRALTDMLGYELPEMVGKSALEFVVPEHQDLVRRKIASGAEEPYEIVGIRKDGTPLDLEVRGRAFVYRGRNVRVTAVRDVTERKAFERRLRHQALHDSLTGLPNRKLFMDRLAHALERTRRTRGRKVAVLFMDLDGFKVVNDSLGHEIGDLLLVIVAERLRSFLRPEDTLARFGGDEFVLLLEEVETTADAVGVARRITEELRRPLVMEGTSLFSSASIGVALGDARTKTPEDLLRDADTAMYRAKEEHAVYRVFHPSMYERAVGRLELENNLRRAIDRGEFVVHYQPIVSLGSGETWGLEALVRWEHPERGLLDPSEFVPVAEESGLVVPMGEAVIEEACRLAVEWQGGPPDALPLVVSVNLSAGQLARTDLTDVVEEALRKTGLAPGRLSLDVTETAYIRVLEERSATLDRLKRLGVGVSIDDFGAGHSSLSYLKRLPADVLKIDRSLVGGVGEGVEDTAIVRMIVELAHTLEMRVVAEGVEAEGQAELLRGMGCDLAQGYYFSRPLPPGEIPRFLVG